MMLQLWKPDFPWFPHPIGELSMPLESFLHGFSFLITHACNRLRWERYLIGDLSAALEVELVLSGDYDFSLFHFRSVFGGTNRVLMVEGTTMLATGCDGGDLQFVSYRADDCNFRLSTSNLLPLSQIYHESVFIIFIPISVWFIFVCRL